MATKYYGTSGKDKLFPIDLKDTNYFNFYTRSGDDYVKTYYSDRSYYFSGGQGRDTLIGNARYDDVHGGAGNDTLYGRGGDDYIYGDSDNDRLYGESGSDHLYGGSGRDTLTGGTGADTFVYKRGDSSSNTLRADTITDWKASDDFLDTPITATRSGYYEASTHATNINAALKDVASRHLTDKDHVFLYNPSAKKGFVLSDLDYNGSFETGVTLLGAGSASAMSYDHIL